MSFKFENFRIWNQALDLSDEIDKIALAFPKHELYSLASQIKRAGDSIVLNIAEGSTLQTNKEFRRFLSMGNRSALEVVACLYIARRRKYIDIAAFENMYANTLVLPNKFRLL
ncbi:MAG: four helix bundle protein [Chitinophagaceae bacterium]|nr:four helix bundle protein [Chitinophagaceae bacterium]